MRFLFAFLALFFLSSAALAQTWTVNAGPAGGYLVDFPGKPDVQQSNDGVRNGKPLITVLQSVSLDSGRIFIGVSATDMGDPPSSAAERDAILANVRNSILNSGSGKKVVTMNVVELGGVPGFDMIYDSPEHNARLRHRIFISGTKLIQQMASGPVGVESSPDTVRFMNSLRLTP